MDGDDGLEPTSSGSEPDVHTTGPIPKKPALDPTSTDTSCVALQSFTGYAKHDTPLTHGAHNRNRIDVCCLRNSHSTTELCGHSSVRSASNRLLYA